MLVLLLPFVSDLPLPCSSSCFVFLISIILFRFHVFLNFLKFLLLPFFVIRFFSIVQIFITFQSPIDSFLYTNVYHTIFFTFTLYLQIILLSSPSLLPSTLLSRGFHRLFVTFLPYNLYRAVTCVLSPFSALTRPTTLLCLSTLLPSYTFSLPSLPI